MPYQPAVLGSARLNNFRLNYLTAAQAAERPFKIRIILGGIDQTARVIYKSLTIRDLLFDAPNTCAFTVYGTTPNVGQPIEVWINSNAPQLLFNGELQTVERTYKGRPATVLHPVTAIDDTARANRLRPLGPWVNTSASTIAQWLVTWAAGFSPAGIEPNLPAVSVNFDGSEAGMKGCLTALAKLIGAYWYFENKTLYFFVTPPANPPDPIDDTPKRFLDDPPITWSVDKSQVRTRVYGKGASTRISTGIAASTDLVPVVNAEMFNAAGGQAIAGLTPDGAASRVLTYTGVQLGGGGGLVGPGASPGAPPGLAPADGAGVNTGTHNYAYTFVTAAGESLPSPISTITVGLTAPPASGPVAGSPTAGGSVNAGTHYYLVTFVTTAGETTNSPGSNGVTTSVGIGVPTPGASSAALRKVVGNLANGVNYSYKTTITTASGESLPGAAGSAITPAPPPTPAAPWQGGATATTGGAMVPGNYQYAVAHVAGGYETALNVVGGPVIIPTGNSALQFLTYPSSDARVTAIRVYRGFVNDFGGTVRLVASLPNTTAAFTDTLADASLGAARTITSPAIGTPPGDQATITIPTSTDGRAVGRKIYRSDAGAPYRFVGTVNNNTATTYIDNTGSIVGQPDAPTSDTTGGASYQTVPITGIAIGPANVTARRLYRYDNAGPYKLVTTIANNTATTYTDTTPTASLGAAVPTTNTAAANQVAMTFGIGPTGTIQRKLYRTAANDTVLKLFANRSDNTTISAVDTVPDSSLGALPPSSDTSGLTQPSGQVPPGTTAIIVANTTPFSSTGGWAVIGNGDQVIRYTGKTFTTLTGIPATGPGAIIASVSYNSTITVAPALVGVTGVVEAIIRNAPIHVWVRRDDLAAQSYMAALDGGGDGVYEHIWSDERRTEASLQQVGDAQLKLYSRPIVTVTYASRDLKTKSGKTVTITLATPAINESLTIQEVTISELGIRGLAPKFTVTASTARQSFESILQMLIRKADA